MRHDNGSGLALGARQSKLGPFGNATRIATVYTSCGKKNRNCDTAASAISPNVFCRLYLDSTMPQCILHPAEWSELCMTP